MALFGKEGWGGRVNYQRRGGVVERNPPPPFLPLLEDSNHLHIMKEGAKAAKELGVDHLARPLPGKVLVVLQEVETLDMLPDCRSRDQFYAAIWLPKGK